MGSATSSKCASSSWGAQLSLRRPRIWAASFAIWTALSLFDVFSELMAYAGKSHPSLGQLLLRNFEDGTIWALLTPFIYALTRKYSFGREGWRRPALVQVLAGCIFAFAGSLGAAVLLPLIPGGETPLAPPFWARVDAMFIANLPRYLLILGFSQALIYQEKYREREMRSAQLEVQLAQAQLQVLKVQLEPHFLFNTLNSIAALSRRDAAAAERMTVQLADLLRISLEALELQEVPLQEELDFVQVYLDIQKVRFHDRLTVRMNVEEETRKAVVPHLILQPLVENSIRHGLGTRLAGGCVEIRACRRFHALELEVIDNGRGLPNGGEGPLPEGVGLSTTRARLKQLYGDDFRFFLVNQPGGGCRVHLSVPFCVAKDEGIHHDSADHDRGRRAARAGAHSLAARA